MIRLLLLLGLVVIFNISVFADTEVKETNMEGEEVTVNLNHPHWEGFYLEQDLFVGEDNEDRNYTMGLGIKLSVPENSHPAFKAVDLIDDRLGVIQKARSYFPDNNEYSMLVSFGAFTPDNLSNPEPETEDRPYSSIISASWFHVSSNTNGRRSLTTQLTAGIIGIHGLAESVQTWIHENSRERTGKDTPVDPQGWDHQISDGGEPTAMYRMTLQQELFDLHSGGQSPDRKILDVAGSVGGSVGYYTMAQAGIQARLGWVNSPSYAHDFNPLSAGNKLVRDERKPSWMEEVYLFGRLSGYGVGYNVLLQGQFTHSDYELSASDVEPFFYEGQYGIAARIKKVRASYSIISRSAEHKLDEARTHIWGSFQLDWNIVF